MAYAAAARPGGRGGMRGARRLMRAGGREGGLLRFHGLLISIFVTCDSSSRYGTGAKLCPWDIEQAFPLLPMEQAFPILARVRLPLGDYPRATA
jgi:hypothetical protein